MSKYELLAPVGSPGAVIHMIEGGADAVYVGVAGFSSRPRKADLTVDEIAQAVALCHRHGVRLYAALNVAVSEKHLDDVKQQILRLDALQVDAVILADIGLVAFCRENLRHAAIHASTLFGAYNIESVRLLRSMGVSRIIFYANLYFDEIAAICNAVPDMEYELVAEGGTCFNDIRQCLLPHTYKDNEHCLSCRFRYELHTAGGTRAAKPICEYANRVSEVLGVYMGIGVTSFKIEGRTSPWEERLQVVKRMRADIDAFEKRGKPRAYLHYFSRANREMD